MAIWAEIKKALNSTLGTNNFKSLDTIISNAQVVLSTSIKAIDDNTLINNTANKTGILSQKNSYIISMLENSGYGLNALKNILGDGVKPSLTGTGTTVFSSTNKVSSSANYKCIAKFIAPVSGIYNVALTAEAQTNVYNIDIKKVTSELMSYSYFSSGDNIYCYTRRIEQEMSYEASTVGGTSYVIGTTTWNTVLDDGGSKYFDCIQSLGGIKTSKTEEVNENLKMYCKAGEPVQIVMYQSSSSRSAYINSIVVTYEKR